MLEENIKKGALFMLLSAFLFALMGATVKCLSDSISSVEIAFFRNLIGTIFIVYSIYRRPIKQIGGKKTLLIFRGAVGSVAMLFYFYNISAIPLGEAMTFSQTSTIFIALFACIFLKEKLGLKGWSAVFVGFVGILLITKFDGSTLNKTDYLGILSGAGAALAYTSVRELRSYYDSRTIVLSFMATGAILPAVFLILGNFYQNEKIDFLLKPFIMPEGIELFYILILGLFGLWAQLLLTKAYALARAGIIGSIAYSNIVFSVLLGFIMGDAFPDVYTLFGISLIVLSGIVITKIKK